MFRIDDPSAAGAIPTPEAAGTEGYFTEGSPGVTNPTLVRASFLNMIQEELVSILTAAGIARSKTTYNQVLSALRTLRQKSDGVYAADTGVANAYAGSYTPAITAVSEGMAVFLKAAHANTGASTFTPNSGTVATAPIVDALGGALKGGEILTNCDYLLVYNSTLTAWVLFRGIAPVETKTKITSGSGTYNTPAACRQLRIRMVGGGGGGSGGGTSGGAGGIGGTTTFNSVNANGGNGASGSNGATGGSGGSGTANLRAAGNGGASGIPSTAATTGGGVGGGSFFGGAGASGTAGATNTGGGGSGGAGTSTSVPTGAGGGGGEYVELIINAPAASYSYAVGAAGTAGTAGTGGTAGQAGGSGLIEVTEIY